MQNRFGRFSFFTKKSFYYQGFFAVKRRAVFILGAKWIALVRGWRRIVWLAAWKLFPMTQSAQSHRQMRSIPRCSKAVFYVFVFGPIHDSTTLLNPPPPSKKTQGLGRVGWVRLSLWGVVLVEAVGVRLRILRFCRFLRWCALPFPLPERKRIRSGRACSCHLRRCWGMADL